MPLPLAPVALFALRAAAVASTVWTIRQLVGRPRPGRTDQRAEDALDAMEDGLASNSPADRPGQHNAALRVRRTVGWGERRVEVDLGVIARLRLRRA